MGNPTRKALVIGLDGVPYTLIEAYMERGELPNLKNILSRGHTLSQMDASIPDVSSTSWTSFFTGVNPGEHGIYGFMELNPGTYTLRFPNYGDVAAPPLWDILGGGLRGKSSTLSERFAGKIRTPLRSVVLNIPQTYPALPLNGVLTSGFVCPDLKRGTYPVEAYDYLASIGYITDVDSSKAVADPDAFFTEVFKALEKRLIAYEHFLANEEWGLFIAVITETDRLHHFFFDAAFDAGHKYHQSFIKVYRTMDEMIGALYSRFMDMTGGEGFFATMSDHGFTEIKKEVYVNSWLRQEGFLNVDREREYFEQIGSGTVGFAMDPGRIYVNLAGSYPLGSVDAAQSKERARELKASLSSITHEGSPVVKAVFERDELYSGRALGRAPDLVCLAEDGFDLKGSLKQDELFGRSRFTGMHTRHDAHCVLPEGAFSSGARPHIEALAGIVLENILGI